MNPSMNNEQSASSTGYPISAMSTPSVERVLLPHATKTHLASSTPDQFQSAAQPYLSIAREIGEWDGRGAGQDYTVLVKNIQGDSRQLLVGVADGHGSLGHLHSYATSRVLTNKLLTVWPIFQLQLKGNDDTTTRLDKITELVTYCYLQTQELLSRTNIFPELDERSGTTMAMALIVVVNAKRYLISTNAGDSQILWSNGLHHVTECSMDHNCDNPRAVELYLARLRDTRHHVQMCLDAIIDEEPHTHGPIITAPTLKTRLALEAQLQSLQPRPVYYSRINCGGPVWDMDMFTNEAGIPQPIKVYRYTGPDQDQVSLDTDNYENISKWHPYGCQSIRYPETYVRADGRTVAIPGHEMDNWGSTLAGGTQTLNGFGDLYSTPHTSPTPYVSVESIDQEGRLIVASDGLTDLYEFKDLINWFWDETPSCPEVSPNTTSFQKRFNNHIFDTASLHPNFPISYDLMSSPLPKWDDVSGLFVSLPSMNAMRTSLSREGIRLVPND